MLEPAAILPDDINAYVALMVAGFIIGVLGHLFRSRWGWRSG